MKRKEITNPQLIHLSDIVLNVNTHFKQSDQVLFKARNETKIIRLNGSAYAAKSFKVPSFLKRVMYTFFRKSKAKRSYLNSLKLEDYTPRPIGCVEEFENTLLKKSYYICEYFDFDFEIKSVLTNANFPDRENILKQFANFSFKLHNLHIFHKDYSAKNILVQKKDDSYQFKIVDVNRMLFKVLTTNERIKNFSRLHLSNCDMKIIVNEYEKNMGVKEDSLLTQAIAYKDNFHTSRNRTNKIKRIFKAKR